MKRWGMVLLVALTAISAEAADPPLEASLVAKAIRDSVPASEKSIVVSLVLKNTGRRPLTIVGSWLGSQYEVKYAPESHDPARKPGTWDRGVVRGTTHSGEPPMYKESEYVMVEPGKEYRTEVDVGSYLRSLAPEGLMPGVYLISFAYSYDPNSAEQFMPLLPFVAASQPVRITVRAKS